MKFKIPYLFLGMVVIIIIIFLAIFSIGYFYHPPTLTELHQKNYLGKETERNFIYNGYSFVKVSNSVANVDFWWTQYKRGEDVYDIPFHYSPREVADIPLGALNRTTIKPNITYITLDPLPPEVPRPKLAQAVYELTEKIFKVYRIPMESACTRNETIGCATRPIVNCENDTSSLIFYFKESDTPMVVFDNNCILMLGNESNFIQVSDRMIYTFLGIMES